MKTIKLLAMVCILCAIASCGVFRNKSKHNEKLGIKESAKVELTTKENSSSTAVVKEKEVDKGNVVTERETSIVKEIPSTKTKVTVKKGDLVNGENFLMDSAGQLIKAILDTLNKTLTIEVETQAGREETTIKERITEHKDFTREKDEQKKDTTIKQTAIVAQQERKESQEQSDSESKPNVWAILMNNIGWGIAFLIIIIGVLIWVFGFKRKP